MDVILLNGPSSSGKSSIAKALQETLVYPSHLKRQVSEPHILF